MWGAAPRAVISKDLCASGKSGVARRPLLSYFPPMVVSGDRVRATTTELAPFVGRARDLSALEEAFAQGHRLVTLVGPAGMGKTRLAQQFVERAGALGWERTLFCDLTIAVDVGSFLLRVASALDVQAKSAATPADLVRSVRAALNARGKVLLVLDNLEHLVPDVAETVVSLLEPGGVAAILGTSRELLRVAGERIHELLPLPEAAEMFLQKVQNLRPDYAPDAEEQGLIDRIVARLDGIPLAIELAAARCRVLSLREILDHLERRRPILTGARGSGVQEPTTMGKAIFASWDLLDEPEKSVFAGAAAFRGGFTFEAASAVLGPLLSKEGPPLLEVLQALRDKSLLMSAPGQNKAHAARLGMYDVIADFAFQRLLERSDQGELRERHARYFGGIVDAILPGLVHTGLSAPSVLLHGETGNYQILLKRRPAEGAEFRNAAFIGAAAEPCLLAPNPGVATGAWPPDDALRAGIALSLLARDSDISPHEADQLDAALADATAETPPPLVAHALLTRAKRRTHKGQAQLAEGDCNAALAIAEARVDDGLRLSAQLMLGSILFKSGRQAEALAATHVAQELAGKVGDLASEATTLQAQGTILQSLGRRSEALVLLERALVLFQRGGDLRGQVRAHASIAFDHLERGLYELSKERFGRALALAQDIQANRMVAIVLGYQGVLCFDHDRLEEALTFATAAVEVSRTLANVETEVFFVTVEGAVRAARVIQNRGAAHFGSASPTHGDLRNEVEQVTTLFGTCEAMAYGNPAWLRLVHLYRGHLDLARSELCLESGDIASARELEVAAKAQASAARAKDDSGQSLVERSDDARIALRILERALTRSAARTEAFWRGHAAELKAAVDVVIPFDCQWFQVGDGPRVDLSRRTTLRPILSALCAHTGGSAAEMVSIDALIKTVWAGQKMKPAVARNRLHVALATLRSLGLRDVLERQGDGYRIDPTVRLVRVK